MHDLKSAAKMMRVALAEARSDQVILDVKADLDMTMQIDSVCDSLILAAQALEAWAWQQETQAGVRRKFTGNCWKWACYAPGGRSWFEYVADTPLGALLAAMEEERDA